MSLSLSFRIAVVGTGLIGLRHAEAVLKEPDAKLIAITDLNLVAKAIAEKLNCCFSQTVQELLVSSSKPDAALGCTPNHTHVGVSQELLNGGVHVL
jgi:predicted dehydrogenase